MKKRPPNLAGTRTFTYLLRHPWEIFRPPPPTHGVEEWAALAAGESRSVACFLRGDFGRYPRRFRQGTIELLDSAPVWRPYFRLRRSAPLTLPGLVAWISIRQVSLRDWNIKSGLFQVLVCTTLEGELELAIPRTDVPLVTTFFATGGPTSTF